MKQELKLKPGGKPMLIATPAGVISIRKHADKPRNLEVILPEGLKAVIGEEKLQSSELFEVVGGKLKPRFKRLVPVVDDQGFIVRLVQPGAVRLEGGNDHVRQSTQPVHALADPA